MSSEFEWRFGDDLPKGRGQEQRGRRRSWRRWLPLFLVLLLAMGGAYAWWRDRQRNLAEAEAQVEQVAQLELRALAEGDEALYLSLQDPVDRSWKEAQEAYLDTRGLPLPLQDVTRPISTTIESARVVGDRAQVEVLYRAMLPSGEEGAFRAVRFYRYTSDGRWLHTKVAPDDVGHDVVFVSDDLEITVYTNDSILVESLVRQLATLPFEFCSFVSCKQYSLLGVDSTTNPEETRSMAATTGLDTTVNLTLAANLEEAAEPDDAVLPASFLVGAPGNAAAQGAWEESLSEFLVDYLITYEIGPRPEDDTGGALVEERLRAWMKAELEVTEPVSPNLDLVHDALENEDWIPLWRLWEVEQGAADGPLAAAEIDLLLAFIEEQVGPSPVAELLHSLREVSGTEQLLNRVPWAELLHSVPEASRSEQLLNPVPWPARSSVELQFPAYVRGRTATSTDDLSAFASYDLLIGCLEEAQVFRAAGLWGWRLASAEPVLLSARPPDEGLVPVSWSPDGARLLLRRQSRSYPSFFLLQSASGALTRLVVPNGANPGYLGPSGWSPDGSRLAYPVFTSQSPGSFDIETRIVDVGTGDEIALDGQFIGWSPDSSKLLYAQPSGSESPSEAWLSEVVHDIVLAQEDGTVLRRIGEGYTAAWSPDGEQIGTISSERALVIQNVATHGRMTVLEPEVLRATLGLRPNQADADEASFALAWSPDGEWTAVAASQVDDEGDGRSTVVLARPGEHRLLGEAFGRIVDLAWAPNGQWVRLFAYDGDQFRTSVIEPDGTVLLHEENAMVTWSSDGQYLALTRFGEGLPRLEIRDVESSKRQKINVSGTCWPPVWNPGGPGLESAPPP